MTRVKRAALAVAFLVAIPGAGQALEAEKGRLLVTTVFDDSGGTPIEGYLNYFRLRDADGRLVFARRAFELDERLEPGRYRLLAYQRTCVGICPPAKPPPPCRADACPVPGGLDPPGRRCKRGLRLAAGRTLRGRLSVNFERGCTLMLSSDRRAVQAAARRAASREVEKFGITYRPRDWRASCRMGWHAWPCRVRSLTGQCSGTLRIRGIPARFRARRVRVGCGE